MSVGTVVTDRELPVVFGLLQRGYAEILTFWDLFGETNRGDGGE